MKVVIQRVTRAKVKVEKEIVGEIGQGLVVLVGFTEGDTPKDVTYMVNKIINLRLFNDEKGIMNYSLLEIGGELLSVSQFTLYANAKKGRRPSYDKALEPKEALRLYDLFNKLLENKIKVETGLFGAVMEVEIINDGPVTIILES